MRKEEFEKVERLNSASDELFDNLLYVKTIDDLIEKYTVPPKYNSYIGTMIFITICYLGLFIVTAVIISLILIIASYIVQMPDASKYIWCIACIAFVIFLIYRIILIVIASVREGREYEEMLEEFEREKEENKESIPLLQESRKAILEESKILKSKFDGICEEYSIPINERLCSNFLGLEVWASKLPDDITFKTCLERYFKIKPYIRRRLQAEEDFLDNLIKESDEFNKQYEENKRREKAMKLFGQEDEPDFGDCYFSGQSTLYYRGVNFMGNMIMEDDNGRCIEVRNIGKFLVNVETGESVIGASDI